MVTPKERPEFLNRLCKMCDLQGSIPRSMVITSLQNVRTTAEYGGGFADVYRGEYDGRPVAVKVTRLYTRSDHRVLLSVGTPFPAL